MTAKIGMAEFIVSAGHRKDYPAHGLPEVALAGRSNVGKSSLINRLAGKKIARTGSSPGTTRVINFYRIQDSIVIGDLPGYGHARASQKERESWKHLVEDYFSSRTCLVLALHLVDSRLAPSALDLQLEEWLEQCAVPREIVATKADKLSGNGRALQARLLSQAFHKPVLLCSATTGAGCREVWQQLMQAVLKPVPRVQPRHLPTINIES